MGGKEEEDDDVECCEPDGMTAVATFMIVMQHLPNCLYLL